MWRTRPRKRGLKAEYEPYGIPYVVYHNYIPDFVFTVGGKQTIIEVKGWFRYEDQRKMRAVKECNPDLDIRIILGRNNQKEIAWCERNGFPWAVETIPVEWFNGKDLRDNT